MLFRSTPIVVVTADARPATAQRAREAGADAIALKPFLPEHLIVEIERLVQKVRAIAREQAAQARG